MPEKILVTSALPYANGPIHLGHLAGAYLPADIFVRYHRLKGSDVLYICGSDEHGVPIMLRARSEGITPQEVVDRFHEKNKKSFEAFGMTFDYYGRTSSPVHAKTSQDFFRKLAEKDEFILKNEKQLYDPEAKMFLADRFVRGRCPACDYDDAYGDQCESCGSTLSPKELKDPRSAITNAKPVLKETTHWYLPLSLYQKKLEKWIASHPEWKSNTLGQINSWFADGLKDRAVTRDLPWGVPVPEDIAEKYEADARGKVLYVWFDAPVGYISATIEWADQKGDAGLWKKYWREPDARLVHFIGKDNIVFHCLIFPAMLMAHGDYVLPDNVPANEFLNLEGHKLSTSRNYAVWLDDYLKKFDPDALRYVLAANLPETRDADFSWKDYQARRNNELADILGNFINRTMTFVQKYFDGKVPQSNSPDAMDRELIEKIGQAPAALGKLIDAYQFRAYIRAFMDLARFANKYFNDKAPWLSRKDDPEKCATTLNLCLQMVHSLSIVSAPVLPFSTEKIRRMLNVTDKYHWDDAAELKLSAGHQLNKAPILFSKLEDADIAPEIERLEHIQREIAGQKQRKAEPKPESDLIDIETFGKIDLRIAEVVEAERVKKSDRLLKLRVRVGTEQREVIAGLAEHYQPQTLIGKKVVLVANLKPATIRGLKSEGMILAAVDEAGLSLLTAMDDIKSGSRIK